MIIKNWEIKEIKTIQKTTLLIKGFKPPKAKVNKYTSWFKRIDFKISILNLKLIKKVKQREINEVTEITIKINKDKTPTSPPGKLDFPT